jgi:hypothetical protein
MKANNAKPHHDSALWGEKGAKKVSGEKGVTGEKGVRNRFLFAALLRWPTGEKGVRNRFLFAALLRWPRLISISIPRHHTSHGRAKNGT